MKAHNLFCAALAAGEVFCMQKGAPVAPAVDEADHDAILHQPDAV
jgi:hypothetical protein